MASLMFLILFENLKDSFKKISIDSLRIFWLIRTDTFRIPQISCWTVSDFFGHIFTPAQFAIVKYLGGSHFPQDDGRSECHTSFYNFPTVTCLGWFGNSAFKCIFWPKCHGVCLVLDHYAHHNNQNHHH